MGQSPTSDSTHPHRLDGGRLSIRSTAAVAGRFCARRANRFLGCLPWQPTGRAPHAQNVLGRGYRPLAQIASGHLLSQPGADPGGGPAPPKARSDPDGASRKGWRTGHRGAADHMAALSSKTRRSTQPAVSATLLDAVRLQAQEGVTEHKIGYWWPVAPKLSLPGAVGRHSPSPA